MTDTTGSLYVVGSGIHAGQVTAEAESCIRHAESVFMIVVDPVTRAWIYSLQPETKSLQGYYKIGQDRMTSYHEMVDAVMGDVRAGKRTCLVSYGHPGVFAFPMHESIRQARQEGYPAKMLPGVSSDGCLFADLGVDPGAKGCQSFEVTDFLVHHRQFDPTSALILWQIGVIGHIDYQLEFDLSGLTVLVDYLAQHYDRSHEVIVYEAATHPLLQPVIEHMTLDELANATVPVTSTLYVPPLETRRSDFEMVRKLNINLQDRMPALAESPAD